MANVRNLKKDINYVLGDIIEAVYIWESANPEKDRKKSEAIIDEAIATFDELIEKVNARDVEDALQKKFQILPLGCRLWRCVDSGNGLNI